MTTFFNLQKVGSYACDCNNGFVRKDDQCQDIDECSESTDTCDKGTSTCKNTVGSFTCQCLPGYKQLMYDKSTCEIDACQATCPAHASCKQSRELETYDFSYRSKLVLGHVSATKGILKRVSYVLMMMSAS